MATGYKSLLSPGQIGPMEVKNRLFMAPMGSNLGEEDGTVGDRLSAYYEARAKGGAGLIIMGVGAISWPNGACIPNQVALSDDKFIPGLKGLADKVHAHGSKLAIQLQHAGKVAVCDITAGRAMLVPSVPHMDMGDMFDALTGEEMGNYINSMGAASVEYKVAEKSDIEELISDFVESADRLRKAGFDGIELHAGHGYILSSFLSPHSNKREDEYGGSLENRARLLVDVIKAVKERVGEDMAVWCRIDATEFYTDDGITFEDAKETARIAEEAGADAIHVSAYADATVGVAFTEAPLVHKPMGFVEFAAEIKKQISIPVIAVGRITPDEADDLIKQGRADYVAMARRMLADPDMPNKLSEGRADEIRPCIYCYTCVTQIFFNSASKCAVNAASGREFELDFSKAETPKKVVVVGGGPAGMEAARVAASRGHDVTLFEKDDKLGGTVRLGAIVYEANEGLIDYLSKSVAASGVDVRLRTEASAQNIKTLEPDVILVANGAKRMTSDLPGADGKNVLDAVTMRTLLTGESDASSGSKLGGLQRMLVKGAAATGLLKDADNTRKLSKLWMPVGRQVVIIGGGLVGLELAEFLADRGRQVTILSDDEKPGIGLAVVRRWRVLHELKEAGVSILEGAVTEAFESNKIFFRHGDVMKDLAADTFIIAKGLEENPSLGEELKGAGFNVKTIGDCNGLGFIEGAIRDGMEAALAI